MKNIRPYIFFISFFLLGMIACKKEQNNLLFDDLYELKYQESVELPYIERLIRLDTINDTRCPLDVYCGHAGWVTVDISLAQKFSSTIPVERITLDLYNKDTIGRLIFCLLEVNPYPLYANPISVEEKQIKLQIESF